MPHLTLSLYIGVSNEIVTSHSYRALIKAGSHHNAMCESSCRIIGSYSNSTIAVKAMTTQAFMYMYTTCYSDCYQGGTWLLIFNAC